jgi:hypothetical protein
MDNLELKELRKEIRIVKTISNDPKTLLIRKLCYSLFKKVARFIANTT